MRCSYTNKKQQLVITTVTLMIIITQVINIVAALYIPNDLISEYNSSLRRQDSDDDEMDQNASAPYQNQEYNNGVSDGYDENDPDGLYGETPREEEGQADLERFFDDHLGASERDGMDKENLPSNIVPFIILNSRVADVVKKINRSYNHLGDNDHQALDSQTKLVVSPYVGTSSKQTMSYSKHSRILPSAETKYIDLPEKKLLITRQITGGPVFKSISQIDSQNLREPQDGLNTDGSEIIATENNDFNTVYITNMTNKPFKIDALGGYDPEEDFQGASRDIEKSTRWNLRGKLDKNSKVEDIAFNDPETDTLYASETDEVTFAQDDPYQVDLEAEFHAKSTSKPNLMPKNIYDDDSEGSWINDGIEDMDIPSQSDQDSVLEKAAKQETLARRTNEADDEDQQKETDPVETDNQRMPNAEYLNDDEQDDEES